MDEAYLRANFDSVAGKANVIEKRLDDNPDLECLISCSQEFKADCEKFNIPNLEITAGTTYDADAFADRIMAEAGLLSDDPVCGTCESDMEWL